MKKRIKHKEPSASASPEPELAGLISKMEQQLILLDRKIDMLISRSSVSQRFDRPERHGEVKQNNVYRERTLYKAVCADCSKECEVPFKPKEDRPVYCKECFAKRKAGAAPGQKQDNKPPEVKIVPESRLEKKETGEKRKGAEKKKPKASRKKR
jgi:CxxC-x17-CxxC domain-containing protein